MSQVRILPGLPLPAALRATAPTHSEANDRPNSEEKGLVLAQEASSQQLEVDRPILGSEPQARLDTAYSRRPTKSFEHEHELATDLDLDLCAIEKCIGHIALDVAPAGVQVYPECFIERDRHESDHGCEVQVT